MSKIDYLRRQQVQEYENGDVEASAATGEILLKEHWHIRNFWTKGYANDLYNLACVYDELENLERAAELYSDSARQIVVVEGEGVAFAKRLSGLAMVLSRLGAPEPAFFMLGSVAAIYQRDLGTHNATYADSLYNLANIAADLGQNIDALRFHQDALRIREALGDTADAINSFHSIAFLYEALEDFDNAASYAETALTLIGEQDDDYPGACNYLAGIYEHAGRQEDALSLYDKVLEIIRREIGREHSAYLNVAYRRANLLAQMERHREALDSHEEVRYIFKNISGTKHIFYANCLRNMAILHKSLGETVAAESLMLESIKIRRISSDDITADIIFLIRLYILNHENEKALEALIYALMRSDSNAPEFSALISALTETFAQPGNAITDFIQAMEVLNDRAKLRPIINKWTAWEVEE